jgi:hypothetical protein
MADPTLKDVLSAIAQVRAEMATKRELAAIEGRIDKRFDKLEKALPIWTRTSTVTWRSIASSRRKSPH